MWRCATITVLTGLLLGACGEAVSEREPGADTSLPSVDAGPRADTTLVSPDATPDVTPDAAEERWVRIDAPKKGSEVQNPVTIRFSAGAAIIEVALDADGWPLHDGRLAATLGSHSYTFSGTGKPRVLRITGYDANGQAAATDQVTFTPVSGLVFPIADKPTLSLSGFDDPNSTAAFGAGRSGGRVHAGCDLYFTNDGGLAYQTKYHALNDNTPVFAIADGKVTGFSYFYLGTYALVVDHGDFTVRYGEVDATLPAGISVGASVTAGQQIAIMGDLGVSSGTWSMLHFEIYSNDATGPLTNTSNQSYLNVKDANYQRRADLMDCRPFLRKLLGN
jgi:murein DD-endopeptidase MepM/ murein hydrolase activator NlpD